MQIKKEIPANKNGKYQIKEESANFYHLRVVEEIPSANRDGISATRQRVILFSQRDFAEYQKFKKMLGFHEEEIIHDPTFKSREVVAEEPESEPEEQSKVEEEPVNPEEPQPTIEPKEEPKPRPYVSPRGRSKKTNHKQKR